MRNWLAGRATLGVAAVLVAALALPNLADAKRLAGGKNAGMQRSAPAQQAPQSPPAQQAAPAPTAPTPSPATAPAAAGATAATAAAAAPAKRSWLGPIAGLAAGLGLAALMSHLGLGEAFANFLMVALLAVAAFFLVRFLMRRFAGQPAAREPALAGAGAGSGSVAAGSASARDMARAPSVEPATAMARSALAPAGGEVSVTGQPLPRLGGAVDVPAAPMSDVASAVPASAGPKLPEGFDLPAFERVAKMIFIRLQAANDKGDLDDLRQFTTPELFASLRLDLQDRGASAQTTDVERVDAQVVEFATEEGRDIVSVRFQGLIREEAGQPAEAFDEVWHLVRPQAGGNWAIAGIQQSQ